MGVRSSWMASAYAFFLAAGGAPADEGAFVVVDTGQVKCYDNRNEIAPPKPGQPFYGQDAQFRHHPPSCARSDDGRPFMTGTPA